MSLLLFNEGEEKRLYAILGSLLFVAVALVSGVLAHHGRGSTKIYFLSVGQGDSSLVEFSNGARLLIDGGPSGPKLLEALSKILPPEDRYIDLVMMSHPQLDHFGGFVDLLKQYRVGVFLGSLRKAELPAYKELHALIQGGEIPYVQLLEGSSLAIGDAKIDMLGPSRTEVLSGELNDTMLVALLRTPDFSALFAGDIDQKIEERIATKYDVDVDVLKVAHHGSRFSSSAKFLAEVSPLLAVIEVGKNTYGHPTKQALSRLMESGARVVRTDEDGIIKVFKDVDVLRVLQAK